VTVVTVVVVVVAAAAAAADKGEVVEVVEVVGAKPSPWLPSTAAAGAPVRKWWGALAWKVCTRWRNRASSSFALLACTAAGSK
jgi:hypothetical protein